ncbi:MAG: putative glycolipid-binding domain-containing protein [Parvibaculaceae bacterium]
MQTLQIFWRRLDVVGLERMQIVLDPDRIQVDSTVLCCENPGFRLDHRWTLDPDWKALIAYVERWDATTGRRAISLERVEAGWLVDGRHRPDLDTAVEPDLSVTPFCNTLPIRRAPSKLGRGEPLDVAYIDASAMTVALSRQRYDRTGPRQFRYVDLGLHEGFEADLVVDEQGLVCTYQHLFERVES